MILQTHKITLIPGSLMHDSTEGQYHLGDFSLQSGVVLTNAFIGYRTYGTLNLERNNVIVFPTWYTGNHDQVAPYIGSGKALDPDKYFIVIPDMFTNGASTSPSNAEAPCQGLNFPLVTPFDNVAAQRRLLEDNFEISQVQLMVGFSMSGQQAYHWAALHSDLVLRACSICGTSKTTPHNWAMLAAYKSALEATTNWQQNCCNAWDPKILKLVASIGATMAMSQDWYRDGMHLNDEVKDVPGVIENISQLFSSWIPADLHAQTMTWMSADVSNNSSFKGDMKAALQSIDIPFLMMPCKTDLYFRVEDNEAELPYIQNGELKVIDSKSGHMAGLPGFSEEDDAFINKQLEEFLGRHTS